MYQPSSPTVQKSTASIPWKDSLKSSYQKNYAGKDVSPIYLSMCNIKRSGDISMHCLEFKGFLEENARFFKFSLAMNDHILMGDIKSDRNAKITWNMPDSKEYYIFKGKFYIASSTIQVTRFPPPKIIDDEVSAIDYWEDQRIQQWNLLDDRSRATFTWPSKSEKPKSSDIAFSCQSLTHTDKSIVHEIAMDNFCLLIYKVTDAEHLDYACFPPKRMIYNLNEKENSWNIQTANP